MILNIINIFLIWLIAFIPIVLWAYIFSYNEYNIENKKRFIIWIIWWIFAVFPILYISDFLESFNLDFLNIFYYFHNLSSFFDIFHISLSMFLFLLFIVSLSFIFWLFIHKFRNSIKIYFKNIIVFFFFIVFISVFAYLLNILFWAFTNLNFSVSDNLYFWDLFFNSFKLIIFYYIIIAFIEESSKHFNFLQSSVYKINSIQKWVLYSIFVALWFAFIENILYLYSIFKTEGLSFSLVYTYFFRSIFSVMVHIFCSSLVSYYFTKAFLLYKHKDLSFPYLKIFIFWLFMWISLHAIFDITLSLWFAFVIFVYFIFWYLYVSSIFYKD